MFHLIPHYINLGLLHFLLGKNLVANQLAGQLQGLGRSAWKTSAPLLLSVRGWQDWQTVAGWKFGQISGCYDEVKVENELWAGGIKFEILDFGMTCEVYQKETEALNFVSAPCKLLSNNCLPYCEDRAAWVCFSAPLPLVADVHRRWSSPRSASRHLDLIENQTVLWTYPVQILVSIAIFHLVRRLLTTIQVCLHRLGRQEGPVELLQWWHLDTTLLLL